MTLPQVLDIWIAKETGVNMITWMSYLGIGMVWLFYGVLHREKPIIFNSVLGIITNGLVVVGILLYR